MAMKKFIALLLVMMLAFVMIVACSCEGDDPVNTDTSTNTDTSSDTTDTDVSTDSDTNTDTNTDTDTDTDDNTDSEPEKDTSNAFDDGTLGEGWTGPQN
jgi:hypothetical protein